MNAIRSITALIAAALASGTALAAPALKPEVTVNSPIVTVGDMFNDAGALAELPLFRAPLPGTTGNVDLTAIRGATARIGLNAFDTAGLTQVRVSRAASIVDEALLATLINNDLRQRGILTESMTANVLLSQPLQPIRTAASDNPARLDNLRYLPANGTFSARFTIDGLSQSIDVHGSIVMNIEAPHLVSSLPAGTVIAPEHIVMRPIPVQQADAQGVATLGQLVGMALNRQSREGMMLRASDVSTPLSIAKNDIVTIYYRQGPMTLTVRGQAVTGAPQGGPLQVLNLVSRRVISATAIAPGAVEVSAAPLTVAGL